MKSSPPRKNKPKTHESKVDKSLPRSAAASRHSWPLNLDEFEVVAKRRLSPMAYAYVAGAAGDERTKQRNREAFESIQLKPRVLVDVSRLDTSVELFGQSFEYPILLAPTAYHKLSHPQGELETARGAVLANALMIVSTLSSTTVEEIGRVPGARLWFQLYIHPDRGFTRDLLARAEGAGCKALCLTVDSPIFGVREREKRLNFHLPASMSSVHYEPLSHKAAQAAHLTAGDIYTPNVDPGLTWKDVDWICSISKLPVLLKGILAPEDAAIAVEHGAAGIIVSNHGGRNLDTVPATVEALPGVVEAARGRIPVLLDGGIHRGTDVLKALALGAKAVLIGRPYVYGVAVGGAEGVAEVVRILRDEFRAAMALCGAPSIASITGACLWPEAPGVAGRAKPGASER